MATAPMPNHHVATLTVTQLIERVACSLYEARNPPTARSWKDLDKTERQVLYDLVGELLLATMNAGFVLRDAVQEGDELTLLRLLEHRVRAGGIELDWSELRHLDRLRRRSR